MSAGEDALQLMRRLAAQAVATQEAFDEAYGRDLRVHLAARAEHGAPSDRLGLIDSLAPSPTRMRVSEMSLSSSVRIRIRTSVAGELNLTPLFHFSANERKEESRQAEICLHIKTAPVLHTGQREKAQERRKGSD